MTDINIRSSYFTAQYSRNTLIRDLLRGLDALRGFTASNTITTTTLQQSTYLPKFPEEPQSVYEQRVKRSYLTNYFSRALDSDSGKILAKKIGIKSNDQDLPEMFWPWLDDTDLEGKAFSVLARDQLQSSAAKGVTLAFVDHTAQTDQREGRPFVREIDIDSILAFKADGTTGKLTFLRWQDAIPIESDEEGIINANVVFELEPTEWRMYRIEDDVQNDQPDDFGEIKRYRNGTQLITDELPVSLFYTNKTGKLLGESPYRTLAELTLEHFQVYSDMKNMLFYSLQPILHAKNAPDGLALSALASYMFVKTPPDQYPCELSWVQVDAGSIEQARKQLDDIQQRIASFSIDNSAIKPGNQTATQSAIDASGANAALRSFAEGLEEHLERILEMMASYTLQPELDIDVTIDPDFSVQNNNDEIKILQQDAKDGRITLETYFDVLIKYGLLPEDFDKELEIEKLQQSTAANAVLGL